MSSLDRLIEGLDVGVEAFAICEVRHDGNIVLEEHTKTSVHYVLSGGGTAWHMTGRSYVLAPHTVIVAPPGSCLIVTCGQQPTMSFSQPDCVTLPGGWQHMTIGDGATGLTANQLELIEAIGAGAEVIQLSGTAAAPEAAARLVLAPDGAGAFLLIRELPLLLSDQVYEVWSIKGELASRIGTKKWEANYVVKIS